MGVRTDTPPAMITFLVVNTLAVGLRMYVRVFVTKSTGYDDWFMILAFAGYATFCSTTFVAIYDGFGADDLANPAYDLVNAQKFFVISTLLYIIVLFLVKVSCALVLYRLASNNKPIRRVLEATIAIMTAWTIVSSTIIGMQCQPLSYRWLPVGDGKCLDTQILGNVGYSITAMDIASGFLFAGLPMFLLRGVQLSPKMKVSVIIVLGLGIVSSIASVLRIKSLIDLANLPVDAGPVEQMGTYISTFVYSSIELGLAIFAASLAALRPLLKYLPWGGGSKHDENSGGAYGYSSSSSKRKYGSKNQPRSEMGPGIQLCDTNPNRRHNIVGDGDADGSSSQDCIVPPQGRVAKQMTYQIEYHQSA